MRLARNTNLRRCARQQRASEADAIRQRAGGRPAKEPRAFEAHTWMLQQTVDIVLRREVASAELPLNALSDARRDAAANVTIKQKGSTQKIYCERAS